MARFICKRAGMVDQNCMAICDCDKHPIVGATPVTRADIDRRKTKATQRRKVEAAIATAVAEFLHGREAAACMGDIVKAVKENRI